MKITYTKENIASYNIAKEMQKLFPEIKLHEFSGSVLGVPRIDDELIIVLSSHKSKNPGEMFTVHPTGNWNEAKYGGDEKTLCMVDSNMMKKIFKNINHFNKLELNWPISMEANHHGPTFDVPVIFVEVGSEKEQWENLAACRIIAKAIKKSLNEKQEYENVFFVGGGHYPKKANKIQIESEYAIGHMLPKYFIEKIDYSLFKQAIEKNVKIPKKVIIDKDCNKNQKEKIENFCNLSKINFEYV